MKTVTFRNAFKLPSIGATLPAGSYRVEVEYNSVMLHGHRKEQTTTIFHIPEGALGPGDLGGSARLRKGELEQALADDQNK